jgi:hypothetical protein
VHKAGLGIRSNGTCKGFSSQRLSAAWYESDETELVIEVSHHADDDASEV